MDKTWVLVADSARARLYTMPDRRGALREREDFVHPESRLHDQELTSDLPGRTFDSAGQGRHAMSDAMSPKKHEAVTFAKALARHLESERVNGHLDELIVIAPPAFLGLLRDELSESCEKLVVETISKNLVKETTESIRDHLNQS